MIRLLRGVVVVLMLIPAVGTAQADIINIADLLATNGAEQGKAYAQKNLGYMYRYGEGMHNGESVPQDYVEAVRWYRLAAKGGYVPAQFNLGEMYYNGEGVPQDYVTSHMWYNLGAATGVDRASQRRDFVAQSMTPADISEAQRRARVCLASNYRDCD